MFSTIKKNEGEFDRTVRIIGSTTVIIYAILTQMWWLLLFAVPLFITGAIGFCGVYALLGISTCPVVTKPVAKTSVKSKKKASVKATAKVVTVKAKSRKVAAKKISKAKSSSRSK